MFKPVRLFSQKVLKKIEDFEKIEEVALPKYENPPPIPDHPIWKFDPRIPITKEYKSNMDIQMGNNWERLSAQLGIIAKEFRK